MKREKDPRYEDYYRKKFTNHLEFNPPSMAVPEGVERVAFVDIDADGVIMCLCIPIKTNKELNTYLQFWDGWLPADEIKCTVKEEG